MSAAVEVAISWCLEMFNSYSKIFSYLSEMQCFSFLSDFSKRVPQKKRYILSKGEKKTRSFPLSLSQYVIVCFCGSSFEKSVFDFKDVSFNFTLSPYHYEMAMADRSGRQTHSAVCSVETQRSRH